jgi:hypothetical protein
MNDVILNAIADARQNKDFGQHANLGAHFANKRTQKKHLRNNRLGKFRKGKK